MKHLHYLHSLSDAPITKQNQFVWEPFGRVMKRNAMHPCYDVMWHNLNDAHDCLGSFTIHYRKHFFLCVCCSLWSGGSRAGLVIISYYLLRESSAELIETNLWVRLRPLTHHTLPSPCSSGTVVCVCVCVCGFIKMFLANCSFTGSSQGCSVSSIDTVSSERERESVCVCVCV